MTTVAYLEAFHIYMMNPGRGQQNVERTTRVNIFLRASGELRLLVSWRSNRSIA